jgi:soluble lytic murein transglycosylase-like protein
VYRATLAAAAFLAGTAQPARAEIAVTESGKILYVDGFQREDDRITLFLRDGGQITCRYDLILNIVPNEVLPPEPTPEAAAAAPLLPRLEPLIQELSTKHGVDPTLVAAVIWVESSGDPRARSRKGARGLMQLMPQTARELGVTQIYDPRENVDGGIRYLKRMLDAHGDVALALAAYNAGPTNVARYGGIPPFPETEKYVSKILDLYRRAREGLNIIGRTVTAPAVASPES